jgi:hypothetical protein
MSYRNSTYHYSAGVELTAAEAVAWLEMAPEEREVNRATLNDLASKARWAEECARHRAMDIAGWFPTNAELSAYYKRSARESDAREEAEWRAGKRSKPRHLRKTHRSRGRIGCDTRRHRADGKLLGGHHGYRRDDRGYTPGRHRERRAGAYLAYAALHGIDEEAAIRHIQFVVEWGERRPHFA